MAEPWLNRVADLALVFQIRPSGQVRPEGYSRFLTNSNGQYQGAILGNSLQGLSPDLRTFLNEQRIGRLTSNLKDALEQSPYVQNYRGYLGVDVLIYKDEAEKFRMHPCVEINCRTPMGLLSLRLSEHLQAAAKGSWKIFRDPKQSFADFDEQMQLNHPLIIKEGLIHSGYLPLVVAGKHQHFGAYLVVEP